MEKQKVLFICRDSAVRSQLAAAFLNAYFGDRYEAYCTGIEPKELNPYAAKVMKEIGIDISSCRIKRIEDLGQNKFACIITLCDFALAHLPTLPEHRDGLHKGFKDFCTQKFCENAGKSKMCFPAENEAPRAISLRGFLKRNTERPRSIRILKDAVLWPRMYKVMLKSRDAAKGSEKDLLTGFRHLREAIFYWVEHEMVF